MQHFNFIMETGKAISVSLGLISLLALYLRNVILRVKNSAGYRVAYSLLPGACSKSKQKDY